MEKSQDILIQDLFLRNLHEDEAIEEALRQTEYKLQLHRKPNEQLGLPFAKR